MSTFEDTAIEHVRKKTNSLGSDQVRHKPGCITEEDKKLKISDVKRGIVLSV